MSSARSSVFSEAFEIMGRCEDYRRPCEGAPPAGMRPPPPSRGAARNTCGVGACAPRASAVEGRASCRARHFLARERWKRTARHVDAEHGRRRPLGNRRRHDARLRGSVRTRVARDDPRTIAGYGVRAHAGPEKLTVRREEPRFRRSEPQPHRASAPPDPRRWHRCPADVAKLVVADTPRDPGARVLAPRDPDRAARARCPPPVVETDPPPLVVADPYGVARNVIPASGGVVRLEGRSDLVWVGRPHGAVRRVVLPRAVGVERGSELGERARIRVRVLVVRRHGHRLVGHALRVRVAGVEEGSDEDREYCTASAHRGGESSTANEAAGRSPPPQPASLPT